MSVTVEQRAHALQRANKSRSAMCEIKLLLASRMVTLEQAIGDERARSLPIYNLLKAQPGWGPRKVRSLLHRLQIVEMKKCGELTPRQRAAITEGAQQR